MQEFGEGFVLQVQDPYNPRVQAPNNQVLAPKPVPLLLLLKFEY